MPSIYVASLADYNSGRLVGRWIDATIGEDGIREEIEEMLKEDAEEGAEEFAIHDYEGFGNWKMGEYESIARVAEVAEKMEEIEDTHGEGGGSALAYWIGNVGSVEEGLETFSDSFMGIHESPRDYLEEYYEEVMDIARDSDQALNTLLGCVDWDQVQQEWEFSGTHFEYLPGYGYAVFN